MPYTVSYVKYDNPLEITTITCNDLTEAFETAFKQSSSMMNVCPGAFYIDANMKMTVRVDDSYEGPVDYNVDHLPEDIECTDLALISQWYGMDTSLYSERELLGLVAINAADPNHDYMPRYAPFDTVQRKLESMSRVILWTNYGDDGNLPSCCFLEVN